MRKLVCALLVLGCLTAPGALAAPKTGCPTVADPAGDTAVPFVNAPYPDDAGDISAINVSTTRTSIVGSVQVVGTLDNSAPVRGHMYEVYLDNGEESWTLRASLTDGETRYELMYNGRTDAGAGSANSWQHLDDLTGSVSAHQVRIVLPLSRLPLRGHRVTVFGRTWSTVANAEQVGPTRLPEGLSTTLDESDQATFRVGDRGCPGS